MRPIHRIPDQLRAGHHPLATQLLARSRQGLFLFESFLDSSTISHSPRRANTMAKKAAPAPAPVQESSVLDYIFEPTTFITPEVPGYEVSVQPAVKIGLVACALVGVGYVLGGR